MIAIILFYNKSNGAQSILSFSQEFRHCNTILFDGSDWILLDFDRTGYVVRRVHCKDGEQLIRSLRVIKEITVILSLFVHKKHRSWWSPWLVRSCNEVSRYAAGVNIGFTFNPVHLYNKLIKYNARRNYEILTHWRRRDGISERRSESVGSAERADKDSERGAGGEEGKPLPDPS